MDVRWTSMLCVYREFSLSYWVQTIIFFVVIFFYSLTFLEIEENITQKYERKALEIQRYVLNILYFVFCELTQLFEICCF